MGQPRDIGFVYVPPYSPDLNPIQMAFSKLKAQPRRSGARTFHQIFDALAEICDLFTLQDCWSYLCKVIYRSSKKLGALVVDLMSIDDLAVPGAVKLNSFKESHPNRPRCIIGVTPKAVL